METSVLWCDTLSIGLLPAGSAAAPRVPSNSARGGGGQRAVADSLRDIPQYYFEWATTIAALPGHEQVGFYGELNL